MGIGALQVGQRLTLGDAQKRIEKQLTDGTWVLQDLATGAYIERTAESLLQAWNVGDLKFRETRVPEGVRARSHEFNNAESDSYRSNYPDDAWNKAKERLIFVRRLMNIPITPPTMTRVIEDVWMDETNWKSVKRPDKAPSWRTVAIWISRYRSAGKDIRALIDRVADKGNRKPRYPEELVQFVDDIVETFYLTIERPSEIETLEEVRGRIKKENMARPEVRRWAVPGLAMLRGRIGQIPAFDRFAARYGLPAARLKFRGAGAGADAQRPLARALMDHCRLDTFVVDESTGLPLGRPWLTLIIDDYSRYVLGYYIGFDEPSNVSAARAIRNAIAPKVGCQFSVPRTENVWDAWGLFEVLVVDNGLEFHGETVERGCEAYGIKIQYCPRKKPWYKGKIERYFRTQNQKLLSSIPGKTFSNIFERGDYDPSKHAVLSLSTLREVLHLWVVDYYHQRDHRVLHMWPAQAWKEGLVDVDRYLPPTSTMLEFAFSKADSRKLDKDGVEYDSLFYQSQDLVRLRERLGSELDVEVRVMDDDLGWIMVVAPDSREIIKAPAVKQDYANGLTRWQHKVCKRYRKRLYEREDTDLDLWEVKQRIRALIMQDMRLIRRGSRQRQKRMLGDQPTSPEVHKNPVRASPVLNATPAPTVPGCPAPEASKQPWFGSPDSKARIPTYKPTLES